MNERRQPIVPAIGESKKKLSYDGIEYEFTLKIARCSGVTPPDSPVLGFTKRTNAVQFALIMW